MTNNPTKRVGLEGYGLEIVERIPLVMRPHEENRKYLETKRTKLGHIFGPDEDPLSKPQEDGARRAGENGENGEG
jgi:3,4-dihydroxy 2-butanone 4-phosphate synthase/GTP cyclohydrolase II